MSSLFWFSQKAKYCSCFMIKYSYLPPVSDDVLSWNTFSLKWKWFWNILCSDSFPLSALKSIKEIWNTLYICYSSFPFNTFFILVSFPNVWINLSILTQSLSPLNSECSTVHKVNMNPIYVTKPRLFLPPRICIKEREEKKRALSLSKAFQWKQKSWISNQNAYPR